MNNQFRARRSQPAKEEKNTYNTKFSKLKLGGIYFTKPDKPYMLIESEWIMSWSG